MKIPCSHVTTKSFFLPFLFPRKKRTKKNSCWLCHWWFLTESICSIWFDPTPKNVIKWARKVEFPIDDGWNIKLSKSYRLGQKLFTVAVDMRAFCSSFYTLLRHSKTFLHPLLAFSHGQIFCRLLQDDKCHSHITSPTSIWWHPHKVLLFSIHPYYTNSLYNAPEPQHQSTLQKFYRISRLGNRQMKIRPRGHYSKGLFA